MERAYIPSAVARQPWGVIVPLLLLVSFGSAVLYSAAGGHFQPWALNHFVRFAVFLGMAMVIARVPQTWFRQAALPGYGMLCVLLVLVELLGRVGGGSQRWLNLGFMQLQPSELMKPGIVLVLSWFYSVLPVSEIKTWRAIVPAVLLLGLPAGLVMLQPDRCSTITSASACWCSLIRKVIHWDRAITSPNRKSRSGLAGWQARALARVRRAIWITCPKRTPISCLPRWRKNGACSAGCSY